MEIKRESAIAFGIAFALIAGFAVLNARSGGAVHGRLRLIEQLNSFEVGPLPGSPPGIYLRFEEPRSDAPQSFASTKALDAMGRELPMQSVDRDWRWIPFGYKSPPRSPRLVTTLDSYARGHRGPQMGAVAVTGPQIGEAPLKPFPSARSNPLPPSADAPFRLRCLKGNIVVETKGRVPRNETWELSAEATDFAKSLTNDSRISSNRWVVPFGAFLSSSDGSSASLPVPYPSDTQIVRVSLGVRRSVTESATIQIPGLRLVRRKGETAFDFSGPRRLKTGLGVNLVVTAPRAQVRTSPSDHRNPTLALSYDPPRFDGQLTVELLAPTPDALGVRSLTLGPARQVAARPPSEAVNAAAFTAVLRVRRTREAVVSKRTYTVAVEKS